MDTRSIFEVFTHAFTYSFKFFSGLLTEFSLSNPFLFTLLCLSIAFGLEAIFPRKIDYSLTKRKGFWVDLFYVVFYDFIIIFLGIYAIIHTMDFAFFKFLGVFGLSKDGLHFIDLTQLNPILHFIIIFLIIDFMEWLAHFLMHRFDFLWAIHKIHHANEEIGVASSRRFHLFEYLVFKPFAFLPTMFLGGIPKSFAIVYSSIIVFFAFWTHANSKVPFGIFNKLINNPNTHLWHHAMNFPNKYGVNFASVLNIWDVLFGVYYNPKDKIPHLGTHDMKEVPNNVIGHFTYPFKYWFTKKSVTNRYDLAPSVAKSKPSNVKSKKKRKKK